MANRIGNGLPSTLTAARIKVVLGLAKSQERALVEALEASASPVWMETAPNGDPYERLRDLLATVEGRKAYEEARTRFQRVDNKQFRRTDFPDRLLESRRKEAFGQSVAKGFGRSSNQDLIERLVEDDAWARLAEVVWAETLISGDGGRLLADTIVDHPETRPYLEQVQASPFQVEDDEAASGPEDEGEAAELAGRIRRAAEDLNIDHLNQCDLLTLSRDALRLADIAKARNIRDRDVSLQKVQVDVWEVRNAEAIVGAAMVVDSLAVLRTRIDRGGMDRRSVDAVLDLVVQLFSIDTRYRETHEQLNRASSEENFASVGSLADTLQALRVERDHLRATIESALADPQPDNPTPEKSSIEDRAERSDSETTVCEAPAEEPHRLVDAPLSSAVASKEEVSEPAAEGSTALGDEGEDREPVDETTDGTAQPDDDEDTSIQQVENDIATAISHDRLGLAYHLARAVPDALPSANSVKLVACNYVTDERAPIDAELPGIAAALQDEVKTAADEGTDQPRWRSHAILTACAALSPALVAPGGPVAELLSLVQPRLGDMPSLRTMARKAADVSMTGVHLPAMLLREDDSLDKWRDRESTLRNETTTWVKNERQSKIKFQAATRVWRRMLEDWQHDNRCSVGHVFGLFDNPAERIDVERVSRISEYWRANWEREIDRIDRENRSRAATKKIVGSARLSLGGKVEQALVFFDRWLSLIREPPGERPQFHTEQAAILRANVNDNAEQALAEIEAVATSMARCAGALLRRYTALFEDTVDESDSRAVGLTELLNGDLLADPLIALDDTGQPPESPLDLDTLRKLARDWSFCFTNS